MTDKDFRAEMLAKYHHAEQTPENIVKYIMWRDKYDMMNYEVVWLDHLDKEYISFMACSYNYGEVERNKRGLKKVADKIFKAIPSLHFIYFSHLIFENN